MQMIKFTDDKGRDFLVNPDYITSITPSDSQLGGQTKMWIVGHSGYGTYSVFLNDKIVDIEAKLKKHHLKYK